ncbi:Ribosomal protein L9/RNase H1, partial [Zea mays]
MKQYQTAAKRLDNALLVLRRFISTGNELRTPVTKDEIVSEFSHDLPHFTYRWRGSSTSMSIWRTCICTHLWRRSANLSCPSGYRRTYRAQK